MSLIFKFSYISEVHSPKGLEHDGPGSSLKTIKASVAMPDAIIEDALVCSVLSSRLKSVLADRRTHCKIEWHA
jgi:hypothetical protein